MKEFLTCQVSLGYGATLQKARRFTEEEKKGYAEWFREKGFVGTSDEICLEELSTVDVREKIGERSEDGSFCGSSNSAYIITETEWNELIELNHRKMIERQRKEVLADLEECKRIVEACEKQEKLYTPEEVKAKKEEYNNLYNEGGYGYIPEFYTIDQYNYYVDKTEKLEKKLNELEDMSKKTKKEKKYKESKEFTIFRNNGVTGAEKRNVYTYGGKHFRGTGADEISVKLPDNNYFRIYETVTGSLAVESAWGWSYDINDVLQGNKHPCFYALDKDRNGHRVYLEVL